MKKISLKEVEKYKDFLCLSNNKFEIIFSTAEDNRSFNRHTDEGVRELQTLLKDFNVHDVQYLKQVHSDSIFVYNGQENFKDNEGDAIITNSKNVAVGVFTADCVPVLLIDEDNEVVAAIHSGWKGTYNSIVKKTAIKMVNDFGTEINKLKVYIGPHIRKCCYEVSEELKNEFIMKTAIPTEKLFNKNNLNLEVCIESDLLSIGISKDNIFSLELCTYCSNEVKLHSYRKSVGTYGRLFSFVIIK